MPSFLDSVEQMSYNAFTEIDFAGSEGLGGIKVANIKPLWVSSSSLWVKL